MGKHILILGGGFGGLAAAKTLRKGLGPEHKVTLVDRQPLFFMGLTKLWVLEGKRLVGEGPGNRTLLSKDGIAFIEGEVTAIDVETKQARVGTEHIGYDYLIIALGAEYSANTPTGFARYAVNIYTESGCAQARDILRSVKSGTVTILVCGLPYKCPPAPYEATMIIDSVLRKKGTREKVNLQIISPEPHPLGILGTEAGKKITNLLADRGIKYYPSHHVTEIRKKSVMTQEGGEIPHDLLFAIPVHVAPSVLKDSRLLDGSGWVPVNSSTLATKSPNVYAIGDCAGTKVPKGVLLPRAGVLAEEQGKVVAENIVREILGESERTQFEGRGVCYVEVGDGKAAALRANFFAEPNPEWEFAAPSEDGYREKQRFLDERMKAWFP